MKDQPAAHSAVITQINDILYTVQMHIGVWGRVVVKALRYQSDGPGIDSRWCHWGFFSVVPPTEPCALRSIQPLKVSSRDLSWGKDGRCVWLTNYHLCSAETSRISGTLTYPEPLGPPRPVAGHLYYMGCVFSATPRPLYPREGPGTHCIGGWVGLRAGLDGCGKSRPHRDSIPGPSSPQRVAVPTELSRPTRLMLYIRKYIWKLKGWLKIINW